MRSYRYCRTRRSGCSSDTAIGEKCNRRDGSRHSDGAAAIARTTAGNGQTAGSLHVSIAARSVRHPLSPMMAMRFATWGTSGNGMPPTLTDVALEGTCASQTRSGNDGVGFARCAIGVTVEPIIRLGHEAVCEIARAMGGSIRRPLQPRHNRRGLRGRIGTNHERDPDRDEGRRDQTDQAAVFLRLGFAAEAAFFAFATGRGFRALRPELRRDRAFVRDCVVKHP